ncbi:hypothetical protein DB35_08245 [Streptomyces abyssalis]|uniref:Uncharacterized protein n=1 Tax=Streptomyces abyssalis TaxID=933944 RepID=A0A1E7JS93_9ACTN|nr:hypothetical protein AN215_04545 [Streptomyces abyssalis]OEU94088.1 hypothetical protein DB35_08245 [Streptomyces abyssalis]
MSVTSTRTVEPRAVSTRRKSRPGTRPCCTAFAASSATIRVRASCAVLSYGMSHASSLFPARRRARRAPRGVELNRIAKWPTRAGT